MIPTSRTGDGRTKVVLVNHTDKVRPEVNKLSRKLPPKEFAVTVVLPNRCQETLTRYEGVEYRFYRAWFVPNIRYTLPHPSFRSVLADELQDASVLHIIGYSYVPCVVSAVVANGFDVNTVVTVDAFPGVSWSYGNRFVDLVAKAYTLTLGNLVFSMADRVVGLGEYLRDDLERFTRDHSKISIIPNGVDTDRFSRAKRDRGATTKLLYVGRLDTVKGVPYLLRAFAGLLEDGGEYELTVVGDGSRRADAEELCRSLGISDAVSFEGWQSNVHEYYRDSDVFVLPSLSEGLPTVIMEAQAYGLPVVSTDVGGAREMVRGGHVVPKRDSDALRAAIEDVASDDLEKLGEVAREHVKANFSLERMVSAYEKLYRETGGRQVVEAE